MTALIKQVSKWLAVGAGVWMLAASAAASERVQLADIIAPLQVRAADAQAKPVAQPRAPAVARPVIIEVTAAQILRALEAEIAPELPEGSKCVLTARRGIDGLRLRADSDWSVQLEGSFAPDYRGRWYPTVSILVDGEVVRSERATVQVALYQDVWVAQRALSRGDRLAVPLVAIERRDVYGERGAPVAAGHSLSGYQAARPVGEGQVVRWEQIEQRPMVRKGEIVDVQASRGALSVTLRARCLEDGVPGQLVSVRNLKSGHEFIATVVGKGLLEFNL